jgi:hypothetical protein
MLASLIPPVNAQLGARVDGWARLAPRPDSDAAATPPPYMAFDVLYRGDRDLDPPAAV